jgi:hypothetical protein
MVARRASHRIFADGYPGYARWRRDKDGRLQAPKYTIPAQGDKASVESDKPVELTSESLTKWTQLKDGKLAQGYANSVIPLDLLYLLLLGAFLGVASTTLVGLIQWPAILPRVPVSAFWLL